MTNESAFAPQALIHHYRLLSRLGAGGMGEVWRAQDLSLQREVAIKVLPAEFATDAERMRRFAQEAKAVGALNHPNILTVFDFGTHEGNPYLVMELLEGQELRAAMQQGALPVREALEYAQQIATGLSAAHAKNVVHRDLKPANLFVTEDGRVKILDFGLAKLMEKGSGGEGEKGRRGEDESTLSLPPPLPHSPSPPLTDPDVVMGTVGYMSPEQVQGQIADHRADIFSFGVILYEMLSGQRAFTGNSLVETMHAILKDEPPELSETNAKISPQLDKIVRRCLEKKPERRFQSASDLGFALEALSLPNSSGASRTEAVPALTTSATEKRSGWRNRIAWLIAGAAVLTALAFGVAYVQRPAMSTAATMRLSVTPPEGAAMFEQPAISPDGRTLAFVARTTGARQIWIRPLDSPTAKPLPGTEGVDVLFWAPNSQALAFYAGGKLKKMTLSAVAPVALCDVPGTTLGTWNRDDVILFAQPTAGIKRISANGGTVTNVTTVDTAHGESLHSSPVFLPDGRHFFYYILHNEPAKRGIYVRALDGGESKQVLATEARTVWAGSKPGQPGEGWLVFMQQGALLAQQFDLSRHQVSGEPIRLAEQVRISPTGFNGRFSLSDNGLLIFLAGKPNQQLVLADRAGQKLKTLGALGAYGSPRFSPDEQRVAVGQLDPQSQVSNIHLLDLADGKDTRVTFDSGGNGIPLWSPDGNYIAWASGGSGVRNLYRKAANGASEAELLWNSVSSKIPEDWSKDGRFMLFTEPAPQTNSDLWILPLTGERKAWPWLKTESIEWNARFSPDGKWIAYATNALGRYEVYVRVFTPDAPAAGGQWQISLNGGAQPQWRRDGRELYYISADEKLMAVDVTLGTEVKAGTPHALFDLRSLRAVSFTTGYAVTGDGQKFLFVTSAEDAYLTPFTVVTNWMVEVKR